MASFVGVVAVSVVGNDNIPARKPPSTALLAPPALKPENHGVRLRPPPEGVTDFSLRELIVSPAGPRGIEFTARARELDGQLIRVTGFRVRQSQPLPWAFLLSPVPLTLHEREYGLAEDLPSNALHVFYPRQLPPLLPPERGMMVAIGTLRLGNREEADGRISAARLEVSALEFAGLPTLGVVTGPTNAPSQPFSAASAVAPAKP